jgi:hypothetical protein
MEGFKLLKCHKPMKRKWRVGSMTLQHLVSRIGLEHVERRLQIEAEHEAQLFGQGLLFSTSKIGASHPG